MNDAQALARSITCLLDSATPQATWGDFQTEWDPIITTLTCKLLMSCGLEPETTWCTSRDGYSHAALSDSFRWLNNSIRPEGNFGTDFWDAAQLAILIERFSLHKRFTAYPSLKQYLWKAIQSRAFKNDPSEWQGPGFFAAAIEYARLLRHDNEVASLTKELLALQSHGSWQGHSGTNPSPFGVWHTAQCIVVLASDTVSHREAIARATAWLKHAQHDSGAWRSIQQYNIYFTSYAILALLHEHGREPRVDSPHVRKALEYLKLQMASDGKCSDLGGTLMCALALRGVVGNDFEKDVTLVDYLLANKNLQRADAASRALKASESEVSRLRIEIERYEKKYADADFVVTKKQLLFLVLLSLFITVFGTIAGVYGLNYAFHTSISTSPPVKQESPQPPVEQSQRQIPPAKQLDQAQANLPPTKKDKKRQPSTPPAKPTRESQR